METRLVKRQRNAQQAAERDRIAALERDFASFVGLGVPPGVVRKVLPMARLLRRVLPLPDDMVDQVALHYLWETRSRIRYLWSWLNPLPIETEVSRRPRQMAVKSLLVRGRWILDEDDEYTVVTERMDRLISTAVFSVDARGNVYTRPWRAMWYWMDIFLNRQAPASNPFFPPNRV